MVIVSAITNVFFSLIVIIIAVVELFFIRIGILDIVGIFLMGILNIIYACMRLYALRVQQRLIENNQVNYYNYENAEPEQSSGSRNYSLEDLFADLSLLGLTLHKKTLIKISYKWTYTYPVLLVKYQESALVGCPVVECRRLSPAVNLLLEPFRF